MPDPPFANGSMTRVQSQHELQTRTQTQKMPGTHEYGLDAQRCANCIADGFAVYNHRNGAAYGSSSSPGIGRAFPWRIPSSEFHIDAQPTGHAKLARICHAMPIHDDQFGRKSRVVDGLLDGGLEHWGLRGMQNTQGCRVL